MVTDITAAEWCEKQMEFTLHYGRPNRTHAMKAGSTQHAELEEEIVNRVEVSIQSAEDSRAVKLMNFIAGVNQLLFDGLTHEIPLFQLMCYKYLWDNLVTNDFPSTHFFYYFGLDPQCTLSCDVRNCLAESGLNSKTFEELVKYFGATFHLLPLANEQLLLRYEYQTDQSLLGEDQFPYDPTWVKSQMQWCLKFWMGE